MSAKQHTRNVRDIWSLTFETGVGGFRIVVKTKAQKVVLHLSDYRMIQLARGLGQVLVTRQQVLSDLKAAVRRAVE